MAQEQELRVISDKPLEETLTVAAGAEPEGSAAGRFLSNATASFNPVNIYKGIKQLVTTDPRVTVRNIVARQGEQFDKAKQIIDRAVHEREQGAPLSNTFWNATEAVGHGLAGALPIVGPAAADAGEQIASGDVAGGLGSAVGLVGQMAIPSAVTRTARPTQTLSQDALQIAGGIKDADAARTMLNEGRAALLPHNTTALRDAADAAGTAATKPKFKLVNGKAVQVAPGSPAIPDAALTAAAEAHAKAVPTIKNFHSIADVLSAPTRIGASGVAQGAFNVANHPELIGRALQAAIMARLAGGS